MQTEWCDRAASINFLKHIGFVTDNHGRLTLAADSSQSQHQFIQPLETIVNREFNAIIPCNDEWKSIDNTSNDATTMKHKDNNSILSEIAIDDLIEYIPESEMNSMASVIDNCVNNNNISKLKYIIIKKYVKNTFRAQLKSNYWQSKRSISSSQWVIILAQTFPAPGISFLRYIAISSEMVNLTNKSLNH